MPCSNFNIDPAFDQQGFLIRLQYTYDAFGHRLVKLGSATTIFQYDQSGDLLEQAESTGAPQVDYIYLNGRPVATIQSSNNQVVFLHDDHLGTPQAATGSSQSVVWSATYQPFGYTSTRAGTIVQNLRLPGQEFEIETGWNHNGFRDYASTLGRYLQSDPIGLGGGLNTYAYVLNNPLAGLDRFGLNTTCFTVFVGGEGAIVGGEGSSVSGGVYYQICGNPSGLSGDFGSYSSTGSQVGVNGGVGVTGGLFVSNSPSGFSGPSCNVSASLPIGIGGTYSWNGSGGGVSLSASVGLPLGAGGGATNTTTQSGIPWLTNFLGPILGPLNNPASYTPSLWQ